MTEKENNAFKAIQLKIKRFRDERDWAQFHDPKNLSQAISIEAAELQEIFLWKTNQESIFCTKDELVSIKNELADIFIFMIYMCDHFNIELIDAVKEKINQNEKKYPVKKSKGNRKKYTDLK